MESKTDYDVCVIWWMLPCSYVVPGSWYDSYVIPDMRASPVIPMKTTAGFSLTPLQLETRFWGQKYLYLV